MAESLTWDVMMVIMLMEMDAQEIVKWNNNISVQEGAPKIQISAIFTNQNK